jgi:hypothetical protein
MSVGSRPTWPRFVLITALIAGGLWALSGSGTREAPPTKETSQASPEPPPTPAPPPVPRPAPTTWRKVDISYLSFEVPGAPERKDRARQVGDIHIGRDEFALTLPTGMWFFTTREHLSVPGVPAERILDAASDSVMRDQVGSIVSRHSSKIGIGGKGRRRDVKASMAVGGTLTYAVLWLEPNLFTLQVYDPGDGSSPEVKRYLSSVEANFAQFADTPRKLRKGENPAGILLRFSERLRARAHARTLGLGNVMVGRAKNECQSIKGERGWQRSPSCS